ncbi:efflux RND transporter permease subunit [Pararoseomonas indoligenes]|uniref:Efflux RND transporter permease subunit n=1 Tax=Roseomonas indoligenes TaxID=2820811 RepID=A0A940MX13_9PROT|nr:CusA/CzcA family heavy metal efflux RND transporter [Pararoseomonas indoligenes]MBP0493253.1 efflux RND transporter permease subunit [Pararoseomonas indoligenes]
MRHLVTQALERRPLVLLFFAVFMVIGVLGFRTLNIEAYPDPVPPTVVVITQNPGQNAEEIERTITIPIEVAMSGLPNLTTLRSTSLFGLSDVRVQFNFSYSYEQAVQQVLNRLGQLGSLPNGAQPGISPASPIGEIMRYRLVGPPGFPLEDLKTLQEWVLDRRFKRVPGVIDVTSFGGRSKTYSVQVDLSRLNAYGLSLPNVVDAIRQGSVNVGAGTLNVGPQSVVVQGIGLIHSLDDIRNVVLGSQGGNPVLVSDVATVGVGNLPRLGIAGHENDDDVMLGTVLMRRGEQTLPTIHGVQAEVKRINEGGVLPPGVKIVPLYDREDLVSNTTVKVVHNILEGVLLILVIQWLFLGDLRGAIVIAATIPFAFFFAVIMMLVQGESANLLSLGALDFGLLVDATVIMVENIFRHLHLARHHLKPGEKPRPVPMTVLKAASEVDNAILFSILIIIAAFIPLFAMGGIEGRIFGPMAKTYAYAIGGALLATFTITPALSATLFKVDTEEKDTFAVKGIRWTYTRLFNGGMRRRGLTMLLAVVMLVGSMGVMSRLGAEFLPTLEEGSIWLRATMPSTISLEEGNPVANRVRRVLMEFPEVITVTSQQGRPDDGTDSAGFFNAEFFVPLIAQEKWTTAPTRDELVAKINARLEEEFAGVEFSFSQAISDNVQEAASGVKGANAVKVIGPEPAVASRIADQIRREMSQVQGIADLGVLLSVGQQTLSITVDRAKAARLGLSVNDVNTAISAAVGGEEAGNFFEPGGDRNFPIVVRLSQQYRDGPDAIGRVPVGNNAVLRDVAKIEMISGASYIYRENSARYVPVRFSVRGRDPASAVLESQDRVERNVQLPQGYRLEWVGEFRNLQAAVARLMVVVPIALAIIAVLLYVAFGRLRETLIVFAMLPLSISGGVLALAAAGLNFSVPAAIGFLALLGITVMEAIIFLSYFNQLRDQEGLAWTPALTRAGFDRLRPVMMTCFASFCGLLPMALAHGIGADVTKPLAIVVVGGIGLVPIFILVVLPVTVDLLGRRRAEREEKAQLAALVGATPAE